MYHRLSLALVLLAGCNDYSLDQGGRGAYATEDDEDWSDGEAWDTGGDASDTAQEADTGDTGEPEVCEAVTAEDVTWFMSADDSNSQAAPVLARASVEAGRAPSGTQRLWEFLNYYSFDYPAAEEGHVRVVGQMRETDEDGRYDLLVAVVAPEVRPEERRPLNLTFSVDTSGSMSGDPLDTVTASMRIIAGQLQEGDVVSIVRWSTSSSIVLDSLAVDGPYDPALLDAIEGLVSAGSTDLNLGLLTAYELAQANWSADRTNRVILMSDGGANTGQTDEDLIAAHADDAEDEGIYLIGVGVGDAGAYQDALMDTVTDLGKGAYVYLDGADEAERQFTGDRFLANMEIAARNVELAMTLPAGWVIERFHGEEMSTDPEEVRNQHLAPNDAMLYHLVVHDCGADPATPFQFSASWQDARGATEHEDAATQTVAELLDVGGTQIDKANAVLAWAIGLTDARSSEDPRAYGERVVDEIRAAQRVRPDDAELVELETVVMQWVQDL